MGKLVRTLPMILIIITFCWPGTIAAQEKKKKKSVNERILEILIEKNIITRPQYEDLLKQAKEEEAAAKEAAAKEKERKEKERLAKKEAEKKKPKVTAGFNNGFYLETADKESIIRFRGRFHGDFKAYLANRLDGEWFPIADTAERPFAGWKNIRPAAGVKPWTDNISHGELIRSGRDETLTVDPDRLRFIFQGMWDKDKSGRGYGQFQWRIGMLTPVPPGATRD